MKFVFILFLLICGMQAYAITPPNPAAIAQADSLVWKDYVGKYKGIEGVFENLIVSVEDDKLMGEATGQGKGQLVADTKADTFNVPGYHAIIIFIRDADHTECRYKARSLKEKRLNKAVDRKFLLPVDSWQFCFMSINPK